MQHEALGVTDRFGVISDLEVGTERSRYSSPLSSKFPAKDQMLSRIAALFASADKSQLINTPCHYALLGR